MEEEVTWGKIIDLDPEVEYLFIRALLWGQHKRTNEEIREARREFRKEVFELVGYGRQYPPVLLQTSEAWIIAKKKIFDAIEGEWQIF